MEATNNEQIGMHTVASILAQAVVSLAVFISDVGVIAIEIR